MDCRAWGIPCYDADMMEVGLDPPRNQPTGLCEDLAGEALALIQRMARGDGAALVALHAMWAPVLLGAACRMLGDRREAEEVLRETPDLIRISRRRSFGLFC